MTTRVLVKPAAGCLVRMPDSYEELPAAGKVVEMDSYWTRKELSGDVKISEAPAQAEPTKGDK